MAYFNVYLPKYTLLGMFSGAMDECTGVALFQEGEFDKMAQVERCRGESLI